MLGMALAILTTVGLVYKLGAELATAGIGYVIVGLLVGGTAGSIMAKRVEMTKMPELVAFLEAFKAKTIIVNKAVSIGVRPCINTAV